MSLLDLDRCSSAVVKALIISALFLGFILKISQITTQPDRLEVIEVTTLQYEVLPTYHENITEEDVFGTGQKQRTFYNATLDPPGVIVQVKGGIGNQLFEYACSYAIAKRRNWPLYINYGPVLSSSREFKPDQREFALDKFNIPLNNLINVDTTKYSPTDPIWISDEDLLNSSYDQSYKFVRQAGYCQSPNYWNEYDHEIRNMFKPRRESLNLKKLEKFIDQMEKTESVAVHVRRGDFLRVTGFDLPISYQRRAIRLMIKKLQEIGKYVNPVFFVFSDDIAYTKEKFRDFAEHYRFVYVSDTNNTSIEDFYLMTLCKHIILPNSTFSWWAAWVNGNWNKIVIVSSFNPSFWKLFQSNENEKRFYRALHGTMYHPTEWIVIDPFAGGLDSSV